MKKLLLSFSLIALYSTVNAQWTSQGTGFGANSRGLSDIEIVDANTVWALAYDGSSAAANVQEFTKTTNGGASWAAGTVNMGDPTLEINNLIPVSADIAWVSAINNTTGDPNNGVGYIFKTTNGGGQWDQQLATGFQTAGSSFLNAVYFFDANNGVAYGDPVGGQFEIYRTTDGGNSWTPVVLSGTNTNPLSGEYGYNSTPTAVGSTLWFPTNKGRLFRTNDMGATWVAYQTGLTDFSGNNATTGNGTSGNVHFTTTTSGLLLKTVTTGSTTNHSYARTFATTSNGGQTWSPFVTFTGTRPILNYIPGTTTIVATSQATPVGTSISTDNGTTWTDLEPTGVTQRGAADFLNASTGWCAGFSDGDPLGTLGIFKLTNPLANQSFTTSSFKVYPNPATSNVTISATDIDAYQLSVTDLSGKVVMAKSLNGIENNVDVSTLSSGAYFFTLSSGNKKETVKILKN